MPNGAERMLMSGVDGRRAPPRTGAVMYGRLGTQEETLEQTLSEGGQEGAGGAG